MVNGAMSSVKTSGMFFSSRHPSCNEYLHQYILSINHRVFCRNRNSRRTFNQLILTPLKPVHLTLRPIHRNRSRTPRMTKRQLIRATATATATCTRPRLGAEEDGTKDGETGGDNGDGCLDHGDGAGDELLVFGGVDCSDDCL